MGKQIAQVVSEAKAAVSKGKAGRPTHTDQIAALTAQVAKLVEGLASKDTEIAALKATVSAAPRTGKGRGRYSNYTPLDNPNFKVADQFSVNRNDSEGNLMADQYTGEPSFNFLSHDGGVSVIPDPAFRQVMQSHYGAKYRGPTKLWRMAPPNLARFNADLASGQFSDFCKPVIEEMASKTTPTTPNGKAIVAFYCE